MREWIKSLDGLLRGEATNPDALKRGLIEVPAGGMLMLIAVLGAFYGVCMACFAAFNRPAADALWQMVASAAKIPLLFLLTLLVTFPSLYVFNALIGSRLTLRAVWQLLVATLAVMIAVLASLGPVVAFFSFSTTGYSFMLMFNVLMCSVAGILGMKFLLFTLQRLTTVFKEGSEPPKPIVPAPPPVAPAPSAPASKTVPEPSPNVAAADAVKPPPFSPPSPSVAPAPKGALEKTEGQVFSGDVMSIFKVWVVVFALVGAQMSWVLRPFIGAPGVPFTWLRERDSNFFEAVWNTFWSLLGA
jgi:hypothetical protein